MGRFRIWRHFDYVLFGVMLLLTAYGVLMVYSANLGSPDPRLHDLWRRQAVIGTVGMVLILLLAVFPRDYQWFGDFWWLAYLLAVLTLVLVLVFGQSEIGEVRGWLYLGSFHFQPAYLAMVLHPVSVGSILSRRRRKRGSSSTPLFGAPKTTLVTEQPPDRPDFVSYVLSGVMTLGLAALIFEQPDMATAAVFLAIWLVMLFVSDVSPRYLVLTGLLGLGSLIPVWDLMARYPYMRDRVMGFLSPGSDPNVKYQLDQAFIAIGSGGLWGKGLGQGTQSQLRYLPVRHTDFVFAVLAEELGFAGAVLLFVLYLLLFLRLLRIILIAADSYGRLLVAGVLTMILFQLVVNVGMNLGMLPVAGLPLPLISYAPATQLVTAVGIGIAESVAMRHRRLEFQ